ncbi:MAG TPA: glycoside hydrolase family 3 C-terminal domain-containing protein [Sphingomonas sp.]|jgi:beta-glucosidase|uniref:glycoside hydrolase family 3 C-terminal domain-containing protein n=1 Tax=Sphingomonas sp. TaxID=28214 RepID=UPI002ED7A092
MAPPADPRRPLLRAGVSALSLLTLTGPAIGQTPAACRDTPCAFLNTALSPEVRAQDLVAHMTLAEKAAQMQDEAPAIPRLGLRRYGWWNEVLHGVARSGNATVFPQAIGLAATFDAPLMDRIGSVIADEGRAIHNAALARDPSGTDRYYGVNYWSPNINIFRDPRWGRGQETYGEDPYLSGSLATAFIHGIQGDDPLRYKGVATPKHFVVHSGPEPLRHGFNVDVSPFDLEDTYTPAFRMAIVEGKADSLMCAYNAVNGSPICGSPLMNRMLRQNWGFKGFVVSDCDSVDDMVTGHKSAPDAAAASAIAVKAGTDLDCGVSYTALPQAVRRGLITEAEMDVSVRRLMEARIRMGLIDGSAYDSIPATAVNAPEHRALALATAEKTMVLLSNPKALLPLSGAERVAVIGPNAALLQSLEGNYTGSPIAPVLPLAAMRAAFGPGRIAYAQGASLAEGMRITIPETALKPSATATEQGLRGAYFDNLTFSGTPTLTRIDPQVNFDFFHSGPDASGRFKAAGFSARWTGVITPPAPGRYRIGFRMTTPYPKAGGPMPDVRVWVDGKLIVSPALTGVTDPAPAPCTSSTCRQPGDPVDIVFADTRPHDIRIDYVRRHEDRITALEWVAPEQPLRDAAVAAARASDVVVAFVGLSPDLEGEEMKVNYAGFQGGDRTSLALPAAQRRLLEAVKATGKPLVVVYMTGGAISDPWVERNADALLQAWYPGEAGGTAIVNTLVGRANPAGRLPYTIYRDVADLPAFGDYAMTKRTYRYYDGPVLHPFGYGLSYTRFAYARPTLAARRLTAGQPVRITTTVRNTGRRDGDEVVQLYVTKPRTALSARHSLARYARIHLKAGESRSVTFDLDARALSQVDAQGDRHVLPGRYTLHIGGGQPGMAPGAAAALTMTGTASVPK